MNDNVQERLTFRRAVYALLILATLVNVSVRVFTARSGDGQTPFHSANDRSRWSTISALVDHATYSIDRVRIRPGWQTIDMVQHRGRDDQLHYYSSKPPLLPTLMAPQYWTIRHMTGLSMAKQPFAVTRSMLMVTNVLPFFIYLLLVTVWIERNGETDFGRVFLVACACWATFLTPFASSLSNHLPAAICVFLATLCLWRVWNEEDPSGYLFAGCGLAAGFAAANELPALSFLAVIGLLAFWLSPRKTLCFFLPAVALVAIGFFVTNYVAHDSWRPPYAHRADGENWYDYPGSYWSGARQGVDVGEPSKLIYLFHVLVGHHGFFSLTPIWCLSLVGGGYWLARGEPRQRFVAALAFGLFFVCVVFYVGLRPLGDRNYGGVTSGFRWFFWLIPLWLMLMLPVSDWLSERTGRRTLAFLLLALSMVSATLPAANPWTHPWIYQLVLSAGYR